MLFRVTPQKTLDPVNVNVYNQGMETYTSQEAAREAGVNVRRWHYLTATLNIEPARQLPGPRGAKLWKRADINKVRRHNTKAAA